MRRPSDFLIRFPTRTISEIEKNIIKRGKRNPVSRHFHARDDKEAIAAWGLELNRILRVFKVRFIASVSPSLTFGLQVEFGVNAYRSVSGVHRDIADRYNIGPDVHRGISNAEATLPHVHHDVSSNNPVTSNTQNDIANTPAIVSDIDRNKLGIRAGADGRNQPVSITRTLPTTGKISDRRSDTCHVSGLEDN